MIRIYFALFIISSLALLSSCNKGSDNISSDRTQSLSYDFTENNCPTGKQAFSSHEALCAGLQDESLNKGCASTLREEYFKTQCPGQVFKPTQPPVAEQPPTTPPAAPPTIPPVTSPVTPPATPVALYPHDTNIVFLRPSKLNSDVCDRVVNQGTIFEILRTIQIQHEVEHLNRPDIIESYRKLVKTDLSIKVESSVEFEKDIRINFFSSEDPFPYYRYQPLTISSENATDTDTLKSLLNSKAPEVYLTDNSSCLKNNPKLHFVSSFGPDSVGHLGLFHYQYKIIKPDAKIQIYTLNDQKKCSLSSELLLRDLSKKLDTSLSTDQIRATYSVTGAYFLSITFENKTAEGFKYVESTFMLDKTQDNNNRIEKLIELLSQTDTPVKITDAKECEDLNQPSGPIQLMYPALP